MARATILVLLAAAFIGSCLLPGEALAQTDTEQVETLYAEGAAFYKVRRYQDAIIKFEAAYALYPEPNLLYNIGRAYEAIGELDIAINRYKACARTVDVSINVRKKALDKALVLKRAVESSHDLPQSHGSPSVKSSPSGEDDAALSATAWTSAGLSVGLLGTGMVFLSLGLEDERRAESDLGLASQEVKTLLSRSSERKIVGGVLLGAGVVSGALSIVLFAAGDGDEEGVRFSAVPIEEGAAVLFEGSF